MKKFLLPALIAVIIVQLLVPTYMIINKYNIIKTGQEFKFKVNPVDPYDAFRGRYVSLYYPDVTSSTKNGKYGNIVVGEDGFAKVDNISDVKPIDGVYVKSKSNTYFSFPVDRYYMDEKMAPKAEILARKREPGKDAYITARIKNGSLVASGLFIDGVAIEDIIKYDEAK